MAFSARRSLATSISRHLNRRIHPSLPHLVPSHHDRSEDPSSCSSSAPPPPTQPPSPFPSGGLRQRSRSQSLTLRPPFGAHLAAHRSFSSAPEVDAAAAVLSDAASSVVPAFPAPFPGEVAAAASDSFLPSAAVQLLIDAVHSFTGLNWWASIALTTVLVRAAITPLLVHELKSQMKYTALRPEIQAINKDMLNSTDPRSKQERKKKLGQLFRKHGVSRLTPFTLLLIKGPIFLSFSCAIRNMIEKVPSLKGGGAYWFTDLTTPDELYIFPVLTSMAFAVHEAHFFYWAPWTLFNFAYRYALQVPDVRQYLNLPQEVPRPAPAAQVLASEGPKAIPAVDSPPAVDVSEQSSSEPSDKSVDGEKKRRTPRVITNRVQ